jgi:hypothetical protein
MKQRKNIIGSEESSETTAKGERVAEDIPFKAAAARGRKFFFF